MKDEASLDKTNTWKATEELGLSGEYFHKSRNIHEGNIQIKYCICIQWFAKSKNDSEKYF